MGYKTQLVESNNLYKSRSKNKLSLKLKLNGLG